MVEIYLFVNPLGGVCLEIEKKKLYNCLLTTRRKYNCAFIPLLNMKTINEFLSRQHIPINDIKRRNRIFLKIYTQPLLTIKQHSYKAEKKADNC